MIYLKMHGLKMRNCASVFRRLPFDWRAQCVERGDFVRHVERMLIFL